MHQKPSNIKKKNIYILVPSATSQRNIVAYNNLYENIVLYRVTLVKLKSPELKIVTYSNIY